MNRNKGIATIAILGIILGVLVIGGIYYWQTDPFNPELKDEWRDPRENLNTENNAQVDEKNKTVSSEESTTEIFNGNPGKIMLIKEILNNETRVGWNIDVDILSVNPKWEPGNDEELYLNESRKIRKLFIDSKTETYECGNSISGDLIPSIKNTARYIENIKIGDIKSFYVTGSHIDKILDFCLP